MNDRKPCILQYIYIYIYNIYISFKNQPLISSFGILVLHGFLHLIDYNQKTKPRQPYLTHMHVRTHTHNIIDDEANNIGPSHAFSEIDANFDWEFGWDSMPQKSDNFCSLLMNEEVMESIKVQQISKHAPDVWPRIEIPAPLIVYLCHCFVLFSLFACLSQEIYIYIYLLLYIL